MSTQFLKALDLSSLAPVRIWAAMPAESRASAAQAFYAQSAKDDPLHMVIDSAIARSLRFRPESVKKMPAAKKAGYLARVVQPDENLAAGLLQALHLEARRPMLSAFLDALEIAHKNGHIEPDSSLSRPADPKLKGAADHLYRSFPPDEVDLYFATLIVFDPEIWGGLLPLLEKRRGR